MSFLVYGVLALIMPQTYSNEINATIYNQTKAFIAELEQVSMQDSGGLFDQFLQNGDIISVELYTDGGQEIVLPGNADIADPLLDGRPMILGIGAYKDREKYLARSLEIANNLENMVQEILTISRLETSGANVQTERINCTAIIRKYLAETEDIIVQKELQMHLDLPQTAPVDGNRPLIEKVFSNLIGNAVKYSPQGASVNIVLNKNNHSISFSVENTGVHIPESEFSKLFDAFYRIDQSRSKKTGGSGLGLYIVQKALEQHGNACHIRNTASGVQFYFTL